MSASSKGEKSESSASLKSVLSAEQVFAGLEGSSQLSEPVAVRGESETFVRILSSVMELEAKLGKAEVRSRELQQELEGSKAREKVLESEIKKLADGQSKTWMIEKEKLEGARRARQGELDEREKRLNLEIESRRRDLELRARDLESRIRREVKSDFEKETVVQRVQWESLSGELQKERRQLMILCEDRMRELESLRAELFKLKQQAQQRQKQNEELGARSRAKQAEFDEREKQFIAEKEALLREHDRRCLELEIRIRKETKDSYEKEVVVQRIQWETMSGELQKEFRHLTVRYEDRSRELESARAEQAKLRQSFQDQKDRHDESLRRLRTEFEARRADDLSRTRSEIRREFEREFARREAEIVEKTRQLELITQEVEKLRPAALAMHWFSTQNSELVKTSKSLQHELDVALKAKEDTQAFAQREIDGLREEVKKNVENLTLYRSKIAETGELKKALAAKLGLAEFKERTGKEGEEGKDLATQLFMSELKRQELEATVTEQAAEIDRLRGLNTALNATLGEETRGVAVHSDSRSEPEVITQAHRSSAAAVEELVELRHRLARERTHEEEIANSRKKS